MATVTLPDNTVIPFTDAELDVVANIRPVEERIPSAVEARAEAIHTLHALTLRATSTDNTDFPTWAAASPELKNRFRLRALIDVTTAHDVAAEVPTVSGHPATILLIYADEIRATGDLRAVVSLRVTGPPVDVPAWAADKAIAHADSIINSMEPSLCTILDLLMRTWPSPMLKGPE